MSTRLRGRPIAAVASTCTWHNTFIAKDMISYQDFSLLIYVCIDAFEMSRLCGAPSHTDLIDSPLTECFLFLEGLMSELISYGDLQRDLKACILNTAMFYSSAVGGVREVRATFTLHSHAH